MRPAPAAPTTKGTALSRMAAEKATSRTRSMMMVESTSMKPSLAFRPSRKARPTSPRRKGSTVFSK